MIPGSHHNLSSEAKPNRNVTPVTQKKQNLMDSIVKETDPGVLKSFSREDLIEFLSDLFSEK